MSILDTMPQDQPWTPVAQRIVPQLQEGAQYSMSQIAELAGVSWDDPTLFPALTYLATAPGAVLDADLVLMDKDEPVSLDSQQRKAVLDGKTFTYKRQTIGGDKVYMVYTVRSFL